jgi:hypothetical protein
MPQIQHQKIGIAFDMHGCPNRCRHCWLGAAGSRTLSVEDVRWGVAQFRSWMTAADTPIRELAVSTWFREPDYSNDYRQLYDLERELCDGAPPRYELLSIWRLARDGSYAEWARSVGPDTCQISFFGLREANDWFYRRSGAFDDALIASERLLEVGMKPRWQIFLTTRLIPDLDGLLALVDRMRLRARVEALGGEFQLFMHPPGPDGAARRIEDLRPTADQVSDLPEAIMAPSRRHHGKTALWRTQQELHAELLRENGSPDPHHAQQLWLNICSNWDVYPSTSTTEPWNCLGNLKRDPLDTILSRFEHDDVPGLAVQYHMPPAELAAQYGDPDSQRIYSSRGDLLDRYRGDHCEALWSSER